MDNGTEFQSSKFKEICLKNKIKQEFSSPNSPHQNGTSERAWRTLFEMARCLLLESGLPKYLWTYAVKYAAYICSRCYNPRIQKTTFEIMCGSAPNVNKIAIFGEKCYEHAHHKKKLDD